MNSKVLLLAVPNVLLFPSTVKAADRPNIIIIQTDEHNFRTLGCYRDIMTEDQAYMWGKGIKVETPNIDANDPTITIRRSDALDSEISRKLGILILIGKINKKNIAKSRIIILKLKIFTVFLNLKACLRSLELILNPYLEMLNFIISIFILIK